MLTRNSTSMRVDMAASFFVFHRYR